MALGVGATDTFFPRDLTCSRDRSSFGDIGDRPLLLMALLSFLTGVQLFCFGLLAELQMRTYHESQGRPIYRVRATLRGNA